MANWRMFSKDVVETDRFLSMPLSSHALYFHLCMEADDDGFVGSPRRVMRSIGSNEDDIGVLIAKHYVIEAEGGIIVITHWNMNNHIRKDRKKDTIYIKQKDNLSIKNGIYTIKNLLPNNQMTPNCQPNVNQMTTQFSLEEVSVDKDSNVAVGDLQKEVEKHFENVLINSDICKKYLEINDMTYFVEIMNKLISLVKGQNSGKLEQCLEFNEMQIVSLWEDTQRAEEDYCNTFNNPDGWIVSRLNKLLKG